MTLPEADRKKDNTTVFGFWMYLMTDFVLFASLFAVFVTLRATTNSVPSQLIDAPYVLIETLVLLTSSFTCGLSLLAARAASKGGTLFWLIVSSLLGAVFVTMELSEFGKLVMGGNSWQTNGFLSSYFTLVGTHGLHIIIGLLWAVALIVGISVRGLTHGNMRKLMLWSMFWHFLDLVWILIFTIVYLLPLL